MRNPKNQEAGFFIEVKTVMQGPDHRPDRGTRYEEVRAVTIVELLIVTGILALLLAVMLPSLSGARRQAQSVVCASNIRQLATANLLYAQENDGRFCPGAVRIGDVDVDKRNLHRWHGVRERVGQPFDPKRGMLVPYLGPEQEVKHCPAFTRFLRAFEKGNGGYGYNNAYLGVQLEEFLPGFYRIVTDETGVLADSVFQPAETLMFADSALVTERLIEYSFAEPRFWATSRSRADPSIHFRHLGLANVAWCDGHVDRRERSFSWSSGVYLGDPVRFDVGWFGRDDTNRFFDLR